MVATRRSWVDRTSRPRCASCSGGSARAARAPDQVDGALQLVTVVGEPGIGKSRLIGDFADHVEELPDLVRWRQGRCLPYGEGVSFWALSEAVKAEAGIMDDDDPVEARANLDAAIDAAVPDEQERGWSRPRLAALLGLGEGDDDAPREERFRHGPATWRRSPRAARSSW